MLDAVRGEFEELAQVMYSQHNMLLHFGDVPTERVAGYVDALSFRAGVEHGLSGVGSVESMSAWIATQCFQKGLKPNTSTDVIQILRF